jgi:hypothetical protein
MGSMFISQTHSVATAPSPKTALSSKIALSESHKVDKHIPRKEIWQITQPRSSENSCTTVPSQIFTDNLKATYIKKAGEIRRSVPWQRTNLGAFNSHNLKELSALQNAETQTDKTTRCQSPLVITSPLEGQVLRSNAGLVEIELRLKSDGANLRLEMSLDGKVVASNPLQDSQASTQINFQLQQVSRGTHSLVATLYQQEEQIQQSPPVTFTLLRRSVIQLRR